MKATKSSKVYMITKFITSNCVQMVGFHSAEYEYEYAYGYVYD